nr:cytochrome P450 [Mycobacterium marinum]
MPHDNSGVLPPGPPLSRSLQAALMLLRGPQFLAACRRRYGNVFTLRIARMGTQVYLADPADIKTVFTGDTHIFHAGDANALLSGLIGDSSLMVLDEEAHRCRRRTMLAPFHRDAVARQAGLMAEIAADNVAGWPAGRMFPVTERMSEITLEVILRTVIGATDPARLAALRTAVPRLLSMGPWGTLALANPKLLTRRPWQGLRERIADVDDLLYAEITDRRNDAELDKRADVLAMLIRAEGNDNAMTDRELRDQLVTLLVAGYDTSATGLAWALERLTRHPTILTRAVAAAHASAAGDAAGDEYLDAVVKETLRIRPLAFAVGRVLAAPVEVAGYQLPAGAWVLPGIGLVHASAALYPDPDRFDPDRMIGVSPGPTTWLPFGGGARRCLGATFALVEMRVVLREILRRAELITTTAADETPKLKYVTLIPSRGARISVRTIKNIPPASPVGAEKPATTPGCPATENAGATRPAF